MLASWSRPWIISSPSFAECMQSHELAPLVLAASGCRHPARASVPGAVKWASDRDNENNTHSGRSSSWPTRPRSSLCRSPPAEHPLGRASARYRAALGPEQRDRSCTGKRWVTPRGFQRRRAVARVISPNTRAVKLTMANAAILVGNIEYQRLSKLECCHDDLLAIKQLLEATEKYEEITIIENAEADPLKSQLRAAVDKVQSPEELLFYFTGHGHMHQDEFFHCATNFDARRPNQTGISTTELHTLLKLVDAGLVVKLIDACYSGTLLVKGEWFPQNKDGFKNLISIASCLDTQTSLTGNPLSLFTEKFRAAALRKTEGPVFYTDIINTLRDEFIDNNSQTPCFVQQHTAREQFVDDASRLAALRKTLAEITTAATNRQIAQEIVPATMTLLERLAAADAKVVKPDLMANFVGTFFDNLIKRVSTSEFAKFFDLEVTEHARFEEATAEEFIILVMSKEKRADNFVTARHTRKLRTPNPMGASYSLLQGFGFGNDMYEDTWDLYLNCTMARTQLRITLTPKFTNLQRIVLVVTCAPSLDHCYIFEVATQHLLRDFGKYDANGPEASRRWWKVNWGEATDGIVTKISSKFTETVRGQLENAEKRLSQG